MKSLFFATALAAAIGVAAEPAALARDNNAGGITVTKEGLEAIGYFCDLIALGVYKCTSPSDPAGYVCNANGCTSLPNTVQAGHPRFPVMRDLGQFGAVAQF